MIKRVVDLTHYKDSLFIFGPRQTGKTHLLKHQLSPTLFIDLLNHEEWLRYSSNPTILSKEIEKLQVEKILIVIDEIQRCPELLNEVHRILEQKRNIQFVMTGSSARKLRRSGTNLLAGRALTFHLHPLTCEEWQEYISLEEAMHFGTLPRVVLEKEEKAKMRFLKSYVETYLKEEIQQEALTRNVPAFARFLELAGFENGNILNFSNIAREIGVHSRTIKEYFEILEDTLVGFFLYPYTRSHRKKLISHPKFFFFDGGIVSVLQRHLSSDLVPGSSPYGRAFEHWILLEMKRWLDYREREYSLSFFRTTDGVEVDCLLEKGKETWAIEIKTGQNPGAESLRGLRSFLKDHSYDRAICVCQTPRIYESQGIEFLPWKEFLKEL
jgi:predicted AAA+ superfamily ATPase